MGSLSFYNLLLLQINTMTRAFLTIAGLLIGFAAYSQQHLSGWWYGQLQEGDKVYPIEIYIEKNMHQLKGTTVVKIGPDEALRMDFTGLLHDDLSMNIYEMEIIIPQNPDEQRHFPKTFQLIYRRSYGEMSLSGFWQERKKSATDKSRKRGTVLLKKDKNRIKA